MQTSRTLGFATKKDMRLNIFKSKVILLFDNQVVNLAGLVSLHHWEHLVMKLFILGLLAVIACIGAKAADWELMSSSTLGVTSKLCVTKSGATFLYDKDSLWLSEDQGRSWTTPKGLGLSGNVNYLTEIEGAIYAAIPNATSGVSVYRSDNGGSTFQLVGAIEVAGNGTIVQIVNSGQKLIAQSNRTSLNWSVDNGATWTEVQLPSEINSIVDVAVGGPFWCALGSGGVFVSTNDGVEWSKLPALPGSGGTAQHVEIMGLQLLVAGTAGAYTNQAGQWLEVKGLPYGAGIPAAIQDLRVRNGVAYAVVTPFGGMTSVAALTAITHEFKQLGTKTFPAFHGAQRGMLQANSTTVFMHYVALNNQQSGTYTIPTVTLDVSEEEGQMGAIAISPNPGVDFVNLYNLGNEGTVRIYSLFGAEVFQERVNSGATITLDVSRFAKGVYYVVVNGVARPLTIQ